ncbi:MAG: hypothetical protein ACI8R8_002253 [Paraglaciecola sp.]|jgi:hypothetical protein
MSIILPLLPGLITVRSSPIDVVLFKELYAKQTSLFYSAGTNLNGRDKNVIAICLSNQKPKTKNQKPKTKNQLTMPVSAPGSAGMESVFVNLVEPGDKVIVCQNGVSAAYAAKCETLRR